MKLAAASRTVAEGAGPRKARTVVITSFNWARSASFPAFRPYPTFRVGPHSGLRLKVMIWDLYGSWLPEANIFGKQITTDLFPNLKRTKILV
jgi:hypothetical protein